MDKCCQKSAALAKIETWEEAAATIFRFSRNRPASLASLKRTFLAQARALRSSLEAKDGDGAERRHACEDMGTPCPGYKKDKDGEEKPCDCEAQTERYICPVAKMSHCPEHCVLCKPTPEVNP